jgi:hypothetical protein
MMTLKLKSTKTNNRAQYYNSVILLKIAIKREDEY